MFKTFLFMMLLLSLTGCSVKLNTISPSVSSKYSLLYEVNYDTECSWGVLKLEFKKGDMYAPLDIKGSKIDNTINESILPESAIGINIFNALFTIIYPDGSFVIEDYPIVVRNAGSKDFVTMYKSCNILDDKPLFKPVQDIKY